MSSLPTNPSEAFRKRNPHIYSGSVPQAAMDKKITAGLSRRLRQDRKPLMNGLEAEWFRVINVQNLCYPRPRPQAKRYQIGNGAWYKPDFTSSSWPVDGGPAMETAWNAKARSGARTWPVASWR